MNSRHTKVDGKGINAQALSINNILMNVLIVDVTNLSTIRNQSRMWIAAKTNHVMGKPALVSEKSVA